jgi:hypothetical protein
MVGLINSDIKQYARLTNGLGGAGLTSTITILYVPTLSARTLWEQFILAQCAKPELDLNKDFGKRRDSRQLGNLQTMMPLDHSYSQDVHDLSSCPALAPNTTAKIPACFLSQYRRKYLMPTRTFAIQ